MKIKILKNVIANIGGKSLELKEGMEIDINRDDAFNLVNGGYASKEAAIKIETKPVVKTAVKVQK